MIRSLIACLLAAAAMAGEALDRLPVLHQGRVKPFAVAAEEVVMAVTGRSRFALPAIQDGQRIPGPDGIPAVQLLMDWMASPQEWRSQPVAWLPFIPLREQLKVPGQWATFDELNAGGGLLQAAAQKRNRRDTTGADLRWTALDEAGLQTWGRMWELDAALSGRAVQLAPVLWDAASEGWALTRAGPLIAAEGGRPWQTAVRDAKGAAEALRRADPWLSVEDLVWRPDPLLAGDGSPYTALLAAGARLREAWTAHDAAAIDAAAATLGDELRRVGVAHADWLRSNGAVHVAAYPSAARIDGEMSYRSARPFTWAWVLFVLGAVLSGVALARGGARGGLWVGGLIATGLGCLLCTAGLGARLYISSWGAVTNLYETVVFVALITGILGLVLAWTGRRPLLVVAAGVGAALCAMVGEAMPPDLGQHIGQLQPVLRSKFWLWVHVKVVVASYAAFVLAWVLGNWALARAAWHREEVRADEAQAMYRCIQVGVVLIAAGTLLGGVWADQAWGRFWGWDPKEVWALVILLVYLIPLHLRYIGLVGPTAMASWSVHGFQSVVMSWYGVNFLLGAGLHAYATGSGFGAGGQLIVLPLIVVQTVLAVWWHLAIRNRPRAAPAAPAAPPPSPQDPPPGS